MEEKRFPEEFRPFLWEHSGKKAPLERILIRVLSYGNLPAIKWAVREYPEETQEILERYAKAPFCSEGRMRGVRFWVKRLLH